MGNIPKPPLQQNHFPCNGHRVILPTKGIPNFYLLQCCKFCKSPTRECQEDNYRAINLLLAMLPPHQDYCRRSEMFGANTFRNSGMKLNWRRRTNPCIWGFAKFSKKCIMCWRFVKFPKESGSDLIFQRWHN